MIIYPKRLVTKFRPEIHRIQKQKNTYELWSEIKLRLLLMFTFMHLCRVYFQPKTLLVGPGLTVLLDRPQAMNVGSQSLPTLFLNTASPRAKS